MKNKPKFIRKIICGFIIMCMMSLPISGTYAETQGQKSIGEIGVDIKWYDFGSKYKNYYIQKVFDADYYQLSMSSDSWQNEYRVGFINGKGEIVIAPDTFICGSSNIGGYSMHYATKGDDHYYINNEGIAKVDGSPYKEMGYFDNGYATVTLKANGQRGVIDRTGNRLFTNSNYEQFYCMGEGIFAASNKVEETMGPRSGYLLNASGELLSQTYYDSIDYVSEQMIKVFQNNKYSFLDLSGNEIIPAGNVDLLHQDVRLMKKDFKWGLIDRKTGKEVVAPVYDEIRFLTDRLYQVSVKDRSGIINKAGELLLPVEYDSYIDVDRYYDDDDSIWIYRSLVASKGNESFLIDEYGKVICSGDYSDLSLNPDGKITVTKNLNNMEISALLDKDGNNLTGFKDFSLYPLNENLNVGTKEEKYSQSPAPFSHQDYFQKLALLDSKGNNLTGFKYSNLVNFSNNFYVVNTQYNGGAGLLNQYGAEVLPTVFDEILLTDEGYAIVQITDPDTGDNARIGFFKIPESFNEKKIDVPPPITVYLNDIELYFDDSEPVIKNERTMVPMRKIFESLGAEIEWNNGTKTVTAKSEDTLVGLTIGKTTATINGEEIQLDAAPFIQNDRTLVPLRFVSESIGAEVVWDQATRSVFIYQNNGDASDLGAS